MAQVASKRNYLGRGVDCREPKETWLDNLDRYTTEKIRDFSDESVTENPVAKKKTESRDETTESKKRVEVSVKATPHRSINLGGELTVKRDSSMTTKYKIDIHSTKILTLEGDGTDPPSKYEEKMSQFILEHIDAMQTKANTKGGEEATATATCLGKMIKDLKEGDSVARLEEYLQHVRSQEESCQQIWQAVADACSFFINKRPYMYTHYVKSVTLGAIEEESEESTDSHHDTSAGTHVTGSKAAGSLEGERQVVSNNNTTKNVRRGKAQNGTVIADEVIEAYLEPVSSLINEESKELKIIMERLLKCYGYTDQGVLLGPFHVSGGKQLSLGREHEIYWQVIDNEIYGTTTANKASTFYVQCNKEQFCHIIYKKPGLHSHFATVQRPFGTECPLKLVPDPKDIQDICFTLMSATKQPVPIPQTEEGWERGSPFFIKLPAGGVPIFGCLCKPERYINIRRIIEKWKKKPISSDADSTSGTPSAPKTRETQNRESTAEKLKYSTGSSASLDEPGQHVITTQFHFTPVESIQGNRVTFAGGPPPPPSRYESDSASGGDEVIRQQQEDNDARLKQDFIKLVGSEYVFPLQNYPVRAVNIPDIQ